MATPRALEPGSPVLKDDLEAFRAQWRAELSTARPSAPAASASTSTSAAVDITPSSPPSAAARLPAPASPGRNRRDGASSSTARLASPARDLEQGFRTLSVSHEVEETGAPAPLPTTALGLYEAGVAAEREGRLNDALSSYRAAFKLDDTVDKVYHRKMNDPAIPQAAGERPAAPAKAHADDSTFKFERTIQWGADYAPETAQERQANPDGSATEAYVRKLLTSFRSNPWVRPAPLGDVAKGEQGPPAPQARAAAEEAHPPTAEELAVYQDALEFIADDVERPVHLERVPREIILMICRELALTSSVVPASVKPAQPSEDLVAAVQGKTSRKGKRIVPLTEAELWGEATKGWAMDIESLERFAAACRKARIISLESTLWKDVCLKTYVVPQIEPSDSVADIVKQEHGDDWRRCFVEHPRIRMDGCFIAVVTYLRRGESSSWYSPSHIITFYRYLRFHPSGSVLSLLSTEPPSAVVRQLTPALRIKGLTIGRWQLRGDTVDCWNLEDPHVDREAQKYSLFMSCRLRSTARGRMNKLDLTALGTRRRDTYETENLPIRTKPFFFSKVGAMAKDW